MIIKMVEIRDSMTFIPALAIKLGPRNEKERYLLARAGYGVRAEDQIQYVLLARVEGGKIQHDPYDWGDRTMATVHQWMIEHFDEFESGSVVDVEFLLGERSAPKQSEAIR